MRSRSFAPSTPPETTVTVPGLDALMILCIRSWDGHDDLYRGVGGHAGACEARDPQLNKPGRGEPSGRESSIIPRPCEADTPAGKSPCFARERNEGPSVCQAHPAPSVYFGITPAFGLRDPKPFPGRLKMQNEDGRARSIGDKPVSRWA